MGRVGTLVRIAPLEAQSPQAPHHLRALERVQEPPRPSLQQKLDEGRVVAKERCMNFQPKDLRKKSKNLKERS